MIVRAYVVRSVALSDPMWQTLPTKREIVFPKGEPPSNDGRRWRFSDDDLRAVVQKFSERTEPAPVYWEHGQDVAKGKRAAGWIDKVELGSDGLYAYIRYTDEARAEIESGAWGFRSPGFEGEEDEEGYTRPRALLEMSLVNEPAIGGMPPVQASAEQSSNAPAQPDTTAQEEHTMSKVTSGKVEAAKKKAVALDGPGIMETLRDAYAIPAAIDDGMLASLIAQALAGKPVDTDEMEMEMDSAKAPEPPPAEAPEAAEVEDALNKKPLCSSEKPRITLVDDGREERIKTAAELVSSGIAAGKVTEATRDVEIELALAAPDAYRRRLGSAPVIAPPAGRIVHPVAADRQPTKTWAERQTVIHRYAAAHRVSLDEARRHMEG